MRDIRSMDVLETLCAALGLATLAGINLYLTVFVTGMAVQFGWVVLPSHLHDLLVLGDPWVIAISGALYLLEFFADKVPWIDTANDAAAYVYSAHRRGIACCAGARRGRSGRSGDWGPSRRRSGFDCSCRQGRNAFDGERFARADFQYWPESWGRCFGLGRLGTFALASGHRVRRRHRRFGRHLDDVSQAFLRDPCHGLAGLAQVNGPHAGFRRACRTNCRRPFAAPWTVKVAAVRFRGPLHQRRRPGMPKGILAGSHGLRMAPLFFVSSAQARAARRRNSACRTLRLNGSLAFCARRLCVFPPSGKAYEFAFERGHSRVADDEIARARRAAWQEKRAAGGLIAADGRF